MDVYETTRQNDATEKVLQANFDDIDGIVIYGGEC
jgi:hypothetical protein